MKRILATLVSVLLAVGLAQAKDIGPGTIEVSGITGGSFMMLQLEPEGASDSVDLDIVTTMVSAEYYLIPNLGVGGLLSYDSLTIGIGDNDIKVSMILIGPQAKYSFSISDAMNAYAVGAIGYSKQTIEVGGNDGSADGWFWRVGGGLQVYATDSVAIDLGLSYQMISEEIDEEGAGAVTGFAATRKGPAPTEPVEFDVSGFVFTVGLSVFF